MATFAHGGKVTINFEGISITPESMKVMYGGNPVEPKETWHLPDGVVLKHVHTQGSCQGKSCVIHKPSNHKMREWPLKWEPSMKDQPMFSRICIHNNKHLDPDEAVYYGNLVCDTCECECCAGLYDEGDGGCYEF